MQDVHNRLFCRLDGLTPSLREQQRLNTSRSLGLLEPGPVPIFEEASQMAARFLEMPIGFLGVMVQDKLHLKSSVGLSRLGLMNEIATTRQLPREDTYCTYVVDSQQVLAIGDTYQDAVFARGVLAQYYNIRSYLGTPLITKEGICIGTLAVMDTLPRNFTLKETEFLTLIARWCLREFERDHLLQQKDDRASRANDTDTDTDTALYSPADIKLKLLGGLTRELRSPLTSIIGMASILSGEVFGSLNQKQKEYIKIIHDSGQQMNSLVNELLNLGEDSDPHRLPRPIPVNLEMLCQQVINDLEPLARQKQQELFLSAEPGQRMWMLDREKVYQILYYLVFSSIESSRNNGSIELHISCHGNNINISLRVCHPWSADELPRLGLPTDFVTNGSRKKETLLSSYALTNHHYTNGSNSYNTILSTALLEANISRLESLQPGIEKRDPHPLLGLLLACHIVEQHEGKIIVQGSIESGYRYILQLPKIKVDNEY